MAKSSDGKSTGRTSTTVDLVAERRDYAVRLKLAGMSSNTILKQINNEDNTRGWGVISLSTLNRDIAAYFRTNRALTVYDYDHLDQMREAHLAQIELVIEKLSIHINTKNNGRILYTENGKEVKLSNWKAFEYADSLEKLHKMQMNYLEAQNWNKGRQNINLILQQNNINAVFNDANNDLKQTPKKVIADFVADLENIRDKLKEEEENT